MTQFWGKTDNNNRIFKQFDHNKRIFLLLIWTNRTGLLKCDNINRMITLSVITLSGFHCILLLAIYKMAINSGWGSRFVSMWSRSRLSISTPKKSQSRRPRKSRQFQKVSLDDRDISIEIEKSWFCLDTSKKSEKSEKSRSRPRNLSRHDIFGKSWQFVSISIES